MLKHELHHGPQSPPKENLKEVHLGTITKAVEEYEFMSRHVHLCIVLLFLIFIIVVAF